MSPIRSTILAFVVLAAAGCASPGGVDMTGIQDMTQAQAGSCSPGATKSCFCLGGGQGNQVCRSDGTSYGTCTGCAGGTFDGGITLVDGGGNPCGTCAGCCNGVTCVPYAEQGNTMCGTVGTTCTSCGAETCDNGNGLCVQAGTGTCNSSTCPNGCCGMLNGKANCFTDNPANCGSGGGTCTTCASGTTCNGSCNTGIDPTHQFLITVVSAQVYNTDGTGTSATDCWSNDFISCEMPDIQVCFGYTGSSGLVQGCTKAVNDVPPDNGEDPEAATTTDTATWTGTNGQLTSSGPFYIPGMQFTSGGIVITVQNDPDVTPDTTIGSETLPAISSISSPMQVGAFQRVVKVTYTMQ